MTLAETLPHAPAAPPASGPSPVLSRRQKMKYGVLIALWTVSVVLFWVWWLQPSHILGWPSFISVSLAIFWLFFLQGYFLIFFYRAKQADHAIAPVRHLRVAMVVTKAPSEPFGVVRETLEAMLAQDITLDTPYDVWLADEDPSPDTLEWCAAHNVQVSTRKGVTDYHRATWPRRTRCKEGNLAYFYDHYGYDRYDIVAQFDADHTPTPSYLQEVLPAFTDPSVGYASIPSICDKNAQRSWAARARLYAEAAFHGIMQSGYSNGWAPMCIGSHYTVRTKALKQVGGLGPELAEDHSTSLLLNAGGWRGTHALGAIAHGDGPASFADMITQEFQWSRSLMTLLLQYTPSYLRQLPPKLRFQFIFCQLWYPLFALFMALMYLMPIIALTFDMRFADVTYPGFVLHALPPMLILIVLASQIRRDGFLRPHSARVISWERMLFPLAQWIWVLWGCAMAIRDRLTGRFVDFRITPKGSTDRPPLPMRAVLPYAALSAGAILPVLLVDNVTDAKGFYLLSLINGLLYAILTLVIVLRHWRENALGPARLPFGEYAQLAAALALVGFVGVGLHEKGVESVAALSVGLEPLQVTQTQFVVSGAGQSPPGTVRHVWKLYWD